jgi:hypothetical protein
MQMYILFEINYIFKGKRLIAKQNQLEIEIRKTLIIDLIREF